METELFCSVLRNLLHLNVYAGTVDEAYLRAFEERYCYHPALQPMFQADVLQPMQEKIEPGILYDFRDRLGICALFFLLEEESVIVGPFVRREFDPERARRAMLSAGLPGSFEEGFRLYHSSFPLCGTTQVIDAVIACIQAFCPQAPALRIVRIDDYPKTQKLSKQSYKEAVDYSSIYQHYELEDQFLRTIEKGDVENVLIAYDRMAAAGIRDKRFTSAVYQDVNVSLAILRTLARKAAENGGASVVEVNEITQRAVQRMQRESTMQKKIGITRAMFVELAEAVDRERSRVGSYSPSIRKAADTLRHNYSQNITLEQLAEQVRLSPSHLSRTFSKEVGMSISQYVAALRCEEAASMLKNSDASIQEIAAYVGYLDNNYFVKVFKKQYGSTPSEYRAGSKGL